MKLAQRDPSVHGHTQIELVLIDTRIDGGSCERPTMYRFDHLLIREIVLKDGVLAKVGLIHDKQIGQIRNQGIDIAWSLEHDLVVFVDAFLDGVIEFHLRH
jgi:hypothetical protein